jgi:hypothetical protein
MEIKRAKDEERKVDKANVNALDLVKEEGAICAIIISTWINPDAVYADRNLVTTGFHFGLKHDESEMIPILEEYLKALENQLRRQNEGKRT